MLKNAAGKENNTEYLSSESDKASEIDEFHEDPEV